VGCFFGAARVAIGLDPVVGRIETGRGFANQSGYQVWLLGLDVANGDVGLAPQQIAQRVGRNHLDPNARFPLPQLPHQRGQEMGCNSVTGRD